MDPLPGQLGSRVRLVPEVLQRVDLHAVHQLFIGELSGHPAPPQGEEKRKQPRHNARNTPPLICLFHTSG